MEDAEPPPRPRFASPQPSKKGGSEFELLAGGDTGVCGMFSVLRLVAPGSVCLVSGSQKRAGLASRREPGGCAWCGVWLLSRHSHAIPVGEANHRPTTQNQAAASKQDVLTACQGILAAPGPPGGAGEYHAQSAGDVRLAPSSSRPPREGGGAPGARFVFVAVRGAAGAGLAAVVPAVVPEAGGQWAAEGRP
jgi:hypothetical protein